MHISEKLEFKKAPAVAKRSGTHGPQTLVLIRWAARCRPLKLQRESNLTPLLTNFAGSVHHEVSLSETLKRKGILGLGASSRDTTHSHYRPGPHRLHQLSIVFRLTPTHIG